MADLSRGLVKLGDMAGKTERDFVDAFGLNPVMISTVANGLRVLQWQTGTFTIRRLVVIFDAQHRFLRLQSRYQC